MATLRETRTYGLSGGPSRRNVSVFHVKLTDSAAKAIDGFRNSEGRSARPTISFSGSRGSITVPCSEGGDQLRIFTFGLTNVASDKLQGTFDCVQQLATGSAEELSCLGVIRKKLKVDATDESYAKARQSMAQAEEETRSQRAIVIKGVGRDRDRGKKATPRASGSEAAAKAKPSSPPQSRLSFRRKVAKSKQKTSASVSGSRSTCEVTELPLRDRVIHLLVLRPYKRSELVLRLRRDGVTDGEGDGLEPVLQEVGELSCGDTFVLKNGLFKDVQKDWPGYTAGERQLLKRILIRRLFEPQQNLLTVPQTQVSPLRETPNSSPVHNQNPSKPEAYTDPLVRRGPRISHLSKKTATDLPRVAKHVTRTEAMEATQQRGSLDPRRLFSPLEGPRPKSDQPPSSVRGKRPKTKRKRSSEQGDRRTDEDGRKRDQCSDRTNGAASADCADAGEVLLETNANQAGGDTDYLLSYSVISSYHQRQSYKHEFNSDYSEYRLLHARIDGVTQQFMELNAQLQQLTRDSSKYKEVHDQVIQAYGRIKKSNPNYQQEKTRCEYLHNKLAHIKKLISAYDQQQLPLDDRSVSATQR
ncbi:RNA polymerase II elongation factor ELL-like [Takifugu flavidus]|uniref:RNA polymerase II elongation factor ELL-like n=1 Tax=Takifugu flavidus TaxID=433684 RepID=UPI0025440180|nr:RNA polymerase II elongation factor ELL-like [Takifugu flavidus]